MRSSFLLLTQESGKKSASRDEAIISARVVFPQPGGPRKSKEGHCLLAMKVDRALPSQKFLVISGGEVMKGVP